MGVGGAGSQAPGAGGPVVEVMDQSRVVASPDVSGREPAPLVHANARALATDDSHVYFGDGNDDTLCSVVKVAREQSVSPTRLARRAPMQRALSVDASSGTVAWIGTPGDVVLRASTSGSPPTTVRDRGIFVDVVADGGDLFFTEAKGAGGLLGRATKSSMAHLASFDGTPRGIAVTADRIYVATSSRLLAATRSRGDVTELASGASFATPLADDTSVYAVTAQPNSQSRLLVRVKKTGGPVELLAEGVREGPVTLHRGILYWFDADRPALLATPVDAPPNATPRLVSRDPLFGRVNALVVDDDGAFIAVGSGDDAWIVVVSVR